jgi:hypothetical protein
VSGLTPFRFDNILVPRETTAEGCGRMWTVVSGMAEIVAEGLVQGYVERPWDMTDERTGEKRSGISRKLKVRLDAPGTGTLMAKVPEDLADDAEALSPKDRVRLTLDVDPKMNMTLSEIVVAAPAKSV